MSNPTPQNQTQNETTQQTQQTKPAILEEDDEFEDFPVEGKFCSLQLPSCLKSLLWLG
jgi:hypothetical protein